MALINYDHLNDLLQSLLDVGCDCLVDSVTGAPGACFISHNQPADDCCLATETRVVTSGGVREIGELVGQEVELMTTDGEWVKAPIRSFGVQPLRRITLARNRERKEIFATGNHRWLLDQRATTTRGERSLEERLTDDLVPGDTLASETGTLQGAVMDPEGVRAGIVFGDGTSDQWNCKVMLYGPKASLSSWFDGERFGRGDHRHPGSISVHGLPTHWKAMPDASGDLDYLLGWLAGYVATDGSVSGTVSSVRLASSVREHMELVRDIAYRLGISTSKINVQMRKGFNDHETPLFSISLATSTLPEGFLIRDDQAQRFAPSTRAVARWRVVEVVESGRVEEVFCATVEGTRAFVLEDNILTGNCDFLAVWVNRIRPRIGAENAAYVTGEKVLTRCGDVGAVMDVTMRLMRPCFPTLKDNPMNPFPGADEMQQAAENLLIDVQMLRCCVASAACQGVLFPIGVDCQDFFIGDITPIGPRGGCAGWDLTFAFELDSCAYGSLSS